VVEIRLEVDPATDPISGLIYSPRGDSQAFVGWLQLMSAVETARSHQGGRIGE
jgi:hypothetical protein